MFIRCGRGYCNEIDAPFAASRCVVREVSKHKQREKASIVNIAAVRQFTNSLEKVGCQTHFLRHLHIANLR